MNLKRLFPKSLPALYVILARITVSIGALLYTLLLARESGAEVLGRITLAITIAAIFSLICRSGLDNAILKQTARNKSLNQWGTNFSNLKDSLIQGGIISFAAIFVIQLLLVFSFLKIDQSIEIIIYSILPLTLISISAGYLRGLSLVATASFMDIGGLLTLSTVILWIYNLFYDFLPEILIAKIFLSVTVGVSGLSVFWTVCDSRKRQRGCSNVSYNEQSYKHGQWFMMMSTLLSFLLQSGSIAFAAIILSDFELGEIRVAERVSVFIIFAMTAVLPYITPILVSFSAQGDKHAIKQLLKKTCYASYLPASTVALFLFIFSDKVLEIFGDDFTQSTSVMKFMIIAQLLNVVSAPFSHFMYITGREKELTVILIVSVIIAAISLPMGAIWLGSLGFSIALVAVSLARCFLLIKTGISYIKI